MKPISQANRYLSAGPPARTVHALRKTDYNYQAATLDDVDGGYVGKCKPEFRAISREYFAREAHHDFASEAVVFCVLMLTTGLPLLNGVSAVVGLLHSSA